MSYILDALKKSEQARVVAATPPQHLLLRDDRELRRRAVWPYWVSALLALNGAAIYVWLRNPPAEETRPRAREVSAPPAPQAVPDKPRPLPDGAVPLRQVPPGPLTQSAPARPTEPLQPPATAATAPAVNPAPATPAKGVALPKSLLANAVPDTSRPVQQSPAAGRVPPASNSALGAGEMPPEVRRELPPLAVSGVMRVQGEVGWVHVNGKLVREGDEVVPGVKVEKILENGVQFSYKGYRFQG